jgi:hypothetical protein
MTNGILSQPQSQAPNELWAAFAGMIDQATVNRFIVALAQATAPANKVDRADLLFQSTGGGIQISYV